MEPIPPEGHPKEPPSRPGCRQAAPGQRPPGKGHLMDKREEAHELTVEALRGVVEGLAPDDYAERYVRAYRAAAEGSDTDEGFCYQCGHYHNPVGCDLAGCDCRCNPFTK